MPLARFPVQAFQWLESNRVGVSGWGSLLLLHPVIYKQFAFLKTAPDFASVYISLKLQNVGFEVT